MMNTELIVLENQGTNLTLTDYYSTKYGKPTQTIPTSFQVLASSITATGISATFTRLLTPGGLDTSLTAGIMTDFSYAYLTTGNVGFGFHDYKAFGALTLGVNNETSSWIPGGSSLANVSLDDNFYLAWQFQGNNINFIVSVRDM
jgi:hypothetical protein